MRTFRTQSLTSAIANRYPDEAPVAADPVIPAAEPTLLGGDTQAAGADTAAGTDTQSGTDTVTGTDTVGGDTQSGTDTVAGDAGADTQTAGADAVPETYDLKTPDGGALDVGMLEAATPVFKELGLTNDQAQKLTDLYGGTVLPQVAQSVQRDTLELLGMGDIGQWSAQAKADKEIGGSMLEENLTYAAAARDKFGTPELKAFLDTSRIGNHPEMVKFFAKIGRAVGEGSVHHGGAGNSDLPLHERMYGASFQKQT